MITNLELRVNGDMICCNICRNQIQTFDRLEVQQGFHDNQLLILINQRKYCSLPIIML